MSGFFLFIPNGKGADPQQLVDVGLADLTSGANFIARERPDSPCDQPGVLVGWPTPKAPQMECSKETQDWQPAIADEGLPAGRYWIGFDKQHPPKPAQLRRAYPYEGHNVELGDGNTWLVPEAARLPQDMIRADDGSWKFEVQRQFHGLWIETLRWRALVTSDPMPEVGFDEFAAFVFQAIKLNYRITPEVANRLRLFNTRNITRPFWAILGMTPASMRKGAGRE